MKGDQLVSTEAGFQRLTFGPCFDAGGDVDLEVPELQ